MQTKVKSPSGKHGKADLTKRILVRASSAAIRQASKTAMEVAGYIIKAENGWVVRVDKDGTETKIKPIERVTRPTKIILD